MKAEINNENKLKFLSLYGGQRVIGHSCDYASFELHGLSFIDLELEIYGDWSGGTNPEKSCMDLVGVRDVWTNLKPVSSISYKDAIELAKFFGVKDSDFWTDQFSKYRTGKHYDSPEDIIYHYEKVGKDICEMIDDNSFFSKRVWHKNESDISIAVDYLRSRGYALPWMGLSVDEMVEAGWIKLIQ